MKEFNLNELVNDSIQSLKSARQNDIKLGLDVHDYDDEKQKLVLADDCIEFRKKMGLNRPEKIQAYQDKMLQKYLNENNKKTA